MLRDVAESDFIRFDKKSTFTELPIVGQFINTYKSIWSNVEHGQLLLKSGLVHVPELLRLLKRRVLRLLTRRPYVLIRESQILLQTQATLPDK